MAEDYLPVLSEMGKSGLLFTKGENYNGSLLFDLAYLMSI